MVDVGSCGIVEVDSVVDVEWYAIVSLGGWLLPHCWDTFIACDVPCCNDWLAWNIPTQMNEPRIMSAISRFISLYIKASLYPVPSGVYCLLFAIAPHRFWIPDTAHHGDPEN